MEGNVEEGQTGPAQTAPNLIGRRRVRPAVRVGLVVGLAAAGITMANTIVSSIMDLILMHASYSEIDFFTSVLNTLIFVGATLGFAGSITVSAALSRRAAAGVVLTLVGGLTIYVTLFFLGHSPQAWNLAWFVAAGIIGVFPQACVSIVLWRKGPLPKVLALGTCAYGAFSVLRNCMTYDRLVSHVLNMSPTDLWLISWVGIVTGYVFYLLWCGMWVDLNARPRRYLGEYLFTM